MIRRAALIAVHRSFQENSIQAVPKPLTSGPEQRHLSDCVGRPTAFRGR